MENNQISIRDAIGEKLVELARNNEKIVIVSADMISTCRLKRFEEEFPNRIFNVGIAEQNMVSFAAGLAHEGFIPFVFTMAPFMSMRACEQIRTDISYENLNVKIVSPYSGCSGGISGPTHWGMEDYAILSSFPNMKIVEPSDAIQAKKLLENSINIYGPVYMRCSTGNFNTIYSEEDNFEIGKSKKIRSGEDAIIICAGPIIKNALDAADILSKKHNINVSVIDLYSLKPFDNTIIDNCRKKNRFIIIQDHNVSCGVGQKIIIEILRKNPRINYKILGMPDKFYSMAHSEYLYKKFGYDVYGIVNSTLELFLKDNYIGNVIE